MRCLLLAGLVLLLSAGAAAANNDSNPYWSWDARYVGFTREATRTHTHLAYATSVGHGGEWQLGLGEVRGWQPHGDGDLVLVQHGTTGTSVVGRSGSFDGIDATWSPDGTRIAYLSHGVLYVSGVGGYDGRPVAFGIAPPSWDVTGPVWSPDGSLIAIASGSSIYSVQADGSGSTVVFSGPNQNVNPSWSPGGDTIAFESNADSTSWSIWLVGADGSSPHPLANGGWNDRFPQWGPFGDRLAFISDRQERRGGATRYQYALFVETVGGGRPTKILDDVHPTTPPRWSPTGAQIAVAAGQTCRRWGIYVVRADGPLRAQRRSNRCS
jgi:Tol biopolymer transport system component